MYVYKFLRSVYIVCCIQCREKSVMPRFVVPGEPEHEVCLHWKVLFDSQKKKEDDLKREIDKARDAMLKESEKAAKEQELFHVRQGN